MTKVKRWTVLVMVVLSMAAIVEAGTITGPPITGFVTADSSKDISLSQGSASFTADLSSYANWVGNIYAIGGYYGGAGIADIQFEDGPGFYGNIDSAYSMVGVSANGQTGWFVYKFVVADGMQTGEGGTISMGVYFNGVPNTQGANMWMGVSDTLQIGYSGGLPLNIQNSFDSINMQELFASDVSGNYNDSIVLNIPVGVTEFYVAVNDAGSSGRMAMKSITVDATVVPEPASVILLGIGLIALKRRKK